MATAHFRTAQGQRVLPIDVNVEGTSTYVFQIGELVTLVPKSDTVPAYIKAAATIAAATHMIALGDETIGGGYVGTDMMNYKASNGVKTTVTDGDGTGVDTSTVKKVGLYPLFDKDDVILD